MLAKYENNGAVKRFFCPYRLISHKDLVRALALDTIITSCHFQNARVLVIIRKTYGNLVFQMPGPNFVLIILYDGNAVGAQKKQPGTHRRALHRHNTNIMGNAYSSSKCCELRRYSSAKCSYKFYSLPCHQYIDTLQFILLSASYFLFCHAPFTCFCSLSHALPLTLVNLLIYWSFCCCCRMEINVVLCLDHFFSSSLHSISH